MDLVAQGTQANQQVQAAATSDSSQLESFPLSTLSGMSECLYPTIVADGSLSTPAADNCSTLQRQITSELDKYLQEAAEKCERYDNYYDGWHVATNTSSPQQEASLLEEDDNIGRDEEVNNVIVPESHGQDTSTHYASPPE